MMLTTLYSESAFPITLVEPSKPRFWYKSEICLLLTVNNNKYLSYVVDSIIFGISVPDYPSRTVESKSLRLYWNFRYFVYFIFIYTTIKLHMANSKVRNSDSPYSICFSRVLLKSFNFLINRR